MKRIILLIIFCISAAMSIEAQDISLTYGPWSFISEDDAVSGGVYPYAGINFGLNDRLEAQIFAIAEAAPVPLERIMMGAGLSAGILGGRHITYFNMYADLDFIYGLRFTDSGVEHNRFAAFRLSPLAIGNDYNGYRDRIFTMGVMYNFDSGLFSFTWNLLIFDMFLNSASVLDEKDRI